MWLWIYILCAGFYAESHLNEALIFNSAHTNNDGNVNENNYNK